MERVLLTKSQDKQSPSPYKYQIIMFRSLLRMKMHFNWTDNKTMELVTALRVVLGRRAVECGLRNTIREINTTLADFFTVKIVPTIRKKGDEEKIEHRPYIFARDVQALIHVLIDAREIDPDQHDVLLGADDGQQSLKVGLSPRYNRGQKK